MLSRGTLLGCTTLQGGSGPSTPSPGAKGVPPTSVLLAQMNQASMERMKMPESLQRAESQTPQVCLTWGSG